MNGWLFCSSCHRRYKLNDHGWLCRCGSPLGITTTSFFPLKGLPDRSATIWRYREAIPVSRQDHIVSLGEGGTPMLEIMIANHPALVKQEQLMPTGSFKDRGASVLVSHMKEIGIKKAVIDSSGNAASAVAAYSAHAGIKCEVFIPAGTSAEKCAQIKSYGGRVHEIRGTRQDAARAALKAAVQSYYASHYWNPFFLHGVKTFSFEIWEQLGGRAPDTLVLPCGNGTLILGADIGFRELLSARRIKHRPRIIAVQAAACAPLYHAYRRRSQLSPRFVAQPTTAEGIAIAQPLRAKEILAAVRESQGMVMAVTESEIKHALRLMTERGFYIEPTAAVAVAGLIRYLRHAAKKETVVSAFTGHGLKAAEKIADLVNG